MSAVRMFQCQFHTGFVRSDWTELKFSRYAIIEQYRIHGVFGGDFNLAVALIWQFGESHLYHQLNVHHLDCRHGFLSMQYSKPPIKMLTNCIFIAIRQIFDSSIIPHIQYLSCGKGCLFEGVTI